MVRTEATFETEGQDEVQHEASRVFRKRRASSATPNKNELLYAKCGACRLLVSRNWNSIRMQKRTNQVRKIAAKVKLLILDVDGVLTDNCFYLNDHGEEAKRFNVSDGMGIYLALRAGLEIALISGRKSKATEFRALDLGIKHVYLGVTNKIKAYQKLKRNLKLSDGQIAYMGDDILDVSVLKKVGLPICVKDANPVVRKFAKFVTKTKGGEGAVREVIDVILESKKINPLELVS